MSHQIFLAPLFKLIVILSTELLFSFTWCSFKIISEGSWHLGSLKDLCLVPFSSQYAVILTSKCEEQIYIKVYTNMLYSN